MNFRKQDKKNQLRKLIFCNNNGSMLAKFGKLPGEYETDFVGDSGNREHTNVSAFGMKGLEEFEFIVLINCQHNKKQILRLSTKCPVLMSLEVKILTLDTSTLMPAFLLSHPNSVTLPPLDETPFVIFLPDPRLYMFSTT